MTDDSRSICATRIGGHAYRYLTARSRRGRVVSSFSGGINLLFEGGEAFVPVQSTNVPLHPWAIEIPGGPLRFAEGTLVRSREGALSFGATRIVLSTTEVEELSLPRFSAHEALIAQRNFPILVRFVEEAHETHQPDPFQEEIDAILAHWQESNDPAVLIGLIGLGAGSTPSGDDILVGILARIYFFENVDPKSEEVLSALSAVIKDNVQGRTSLPSAQMLLAACDRSFPEPVLALLKSLTSEGTSEDDLVEKADRVFQLGHHSGLAMLLGMKAEFVPRSAPTPSVP